MSVTKYVLLRCIMCGYPHAVNASFADGRSCVELLQPLGAVEGDSITVEPHDAVLLAQQ